MTGVLVFALLAACSCLLSGQPPGWPRAPDKAPAAGPRGRRPAPVEMAQLVRQLAALLDAGQGGPALWAAVATVLGSDYGPDHATVRVVTAVQRATALGVPSGTAIRYACAAVGPMPDGGWHRTASAGLTSQELRAWGEVAACFRVSDGSGAPIAGILERLAGRFEAEADVAAMRRTALAGPHATVRLLTWLPLLGVGLGMVMGANPIGLLVGGPVGWVCLGVGGGLLTLGRVWAQRLIRAAARPSGPTPGRLRHHTAARQEVPSWPS